VKPADLSSRLAGQVVARVVQDDSGAIAIYFESGLSLVLRCEGADLGSSLRRPIEEADDPDRGPRPTSRQREYLSFIRRYMARYGISPAESDIQQHFMVSAPSVNQMVRTLERRGFITRDRDWFGNVQPRSIRVLIEDP
jgi:hypothetical protein